MKRLIVLAGCNGAGKTTAAFGMLEQALNVREFVNADEIAKGISHFTLYMGLADEWIFIDNSSYQGRVIADSTGVHEPNLWKIVSSLRSTK